jgi:hypothetical protein
MAYAGDESIEREEITGLSTHAGHYPEGVATERLAGQIAAVGREDGHQLS